MLIRKKSEHFDFNFTCMYKALSLFKVDFTNDKVFHFLRSNNLLVVIYKAIRIFNFVLEKVSKQIYIFLQQQYFLFLCGNLKSTSVFNNKLTIITSNFNI